jgi:predicted methyltransferase
MIKMKTVLLALLLALPAASPAAVPADVAAAVAAKDRPADAVKLDESRRPVEVLKFLGLKKGDRALDLVTGSGYYAEIMARAVGPKGFALGWEPIGFLDEKGRQAFTEMKARVPNFGYFATSASGLSLPSDTFDFVMLHLNYHDTYWESAKYNFPRMDPAAFLRTVYQSVKPGGIIGVIDHVANPGGDPREVTEALHRIDPARVRADFEAAGFVFDGQSDLLANPADDHSKMVFDPSIRGKTDRFVYRFRKPRG